MQNEQCQCKLHGYYSKFANLHIFNLTNVGDFETSMCKIEHFLYFALYDANALIIL